MLSLKTGREFAVIVGPKGKVVEVLAIHERDKVHLEEDPELRTTLEKYGSVIRSDDPERLVTSFTLNEGYTLRAVPGLFKKEGNEQRVALSVVGKAGSGKSFWTAAYVAAYHHRYPQNRIFYVSLNRIAADPSYEPLLKKKSFQKVLFEVSVSKIDKPLDSGAFSNVLFVFDDILDVEIPVVPAMIQGDLKREKENSYYAKEQARLQRKKGNEKLSEEELKKRVPPLTQHQIDAMTMDKAVLTRLQKQKAEYIRSCIHDTVSNFLKNGRKHGISVVCTNHDLFSRAPVVQTINSESGLVVLFPYANVSSEKLVEFLRDKLSFSTAQARTVTRRVFVNFEPLCINTTGRKFFFTPHYLEFL